MLSLLETTRKVFNRRNRYPDDAPGQGDCSCAELYLQIEELNHDLLQLNNHIVNLVMQNEDLMESVDSKERLLKIHQDKVCKVELDHTIEILDFATKLAEESEKKNRAEVQTLELVNTIRLMLPFVPPGHVEVEAKIQAALNDADQADQALSKIRSMDGALYELANTDWDDINPPSSVAPLVKSIANRGLGKSS